MSVACCWVVSPPQELEVGARRVPYLLVIEHFISEDSYLFCLIFGGPKKSLINSSSLVSGGGLLSTTNEYLVQNLIICVVALKKACWY